MGDQSRARGRDPSDRKPVTSMPSKLDDQRAKRKAYWIKNKDRLHAIKRSYYERNKERIKAKVRAYQKKNRAKIRVKMRKRRAANPKFFQDRAKKYYLKNAETLRARSRAYHHEHRDRLLEYMKGLYRKNRKHRIEHQKQYYFSNHEKCKASAKAAYWRDPDESRASRRLSRLKNIRRERRRDKVRTEMRRHLPGEKVRRAAYYQQTKEIRIKYPFGKSIIAKAFFGNRCGRCGYDRNLDALEFDHIKKPRKRGRTRHWVDRGPSVLKRPDRFRLLCANCHAIRTTLQKMGKAKDLRLQKERQRDRYLLIDKFGGCCAFCGYKEDRMAFEFDHTEPIWGKNRSSAIHHVRKFPHLFQLLCANCHTLKTIQDMIKAGRRKNLPPASIAPLPTPRVHGILT